MDIKDSLIENFINKIQNILIKILNHENNGFQTKEFQTVSNLLWAINNFPTVKIPGIRIGIVSIEDEHFGEVVLQYKDNLTLSKQGFERTNAGSDSFESILSKVAYSDVKDGEILNFDYEGFDYWARNDYPTK